MKKIIALTLAALMLILSLSSCVPDAEPSTDDTTNQDQSTEDNSQNDNSETPSPAEGELLSNDSELVLALVDHLDHFLAEGHIGDSSIWYKIEMIKRGMQPLLLDFTSSEPYYVCGFHNMEHDAEYAFCCAEKYTWVKYDSLDKIPEEYNGEGLFVSFQINKATYVKDLLSGKENEIDFEHFQLYRIPHGNGEILSSDFEKIFIYLNDSDKSTIYYSTDVYDNVMRIIPCINLDENYYIRYWLYLENLDGSHTDIDYDYLAVNFGKYYDDMMSIMITDKYSVTNDNGAVIHYGIIDVDDLAEKILGGEE